MLSTYPAHLSHICGRVIAYADEMYQTLYGSHTIICMAHIIARLHVVCLKPGWLQQRLRLSTTANWHLQHLAAIHEYYLHQSSSAIQYQFTAVHKLILYCNAQADSWAHCRALQRPRPEVAVGGSMLQALSTGISSTRKLPSHQCRTAGTAAPWLSCVAELDGWAALGEGAAAACARPWSGGISGKLCH